MTITIKDSTSDIELGNLTADDAPQQVQGGSLLHIKGIKDRDCPGGICQLHRPVEEDNENARNINIIKEDKKLGCCASLNNCISTMITIFLCPIRTLLCIDNNGCCCCECHICDNRRFKDESDDTDRSIFENLNAIIETTTLDPCQQRIFKMRFIRRLRKLRKDKECSSLTHCLCQIVIK